MTETQEPTQEEIGELVMSAHGNYARVAELLEQSSRAGKSQ